MSFVSDVDECLSDPCMNDATCKDELNGYACNCAVGYSGNHCETGKYNLYGAVIMINNSLFQQHITNIQIHFKTIQWCCSDDT